MKKFLNKKAQLTPAGLNTAMAVVQIVSYAFMSMGVIQLLAWMWPPFGTFSDWAVTTLFGGYTLLFLFIAAGCIGVVINELVGKIFNPALNADLKVFDKRVIVFAVIGGLCLAMGAGITLLGNAGLVPHAVIQSMILP